MKMIAGAAALAWLKRSRTRLAPTPTIASMNSDAAIEKNGTSASPATARARSVLPVPGAPDSSTPRGTRAPRRVYFSGLRRKSTTSRQLPGSLVDAGDVLERDPLLVAFVAARLRLAERAQRPTGSQPSPQASRDEHEEPGEEQPRRDAEQQLLPQRRADVGVLGVDYDSLGRQQGIERVVVDERRKLRLEPDSRTALRARRRGGLLLEVTLDRVSRRHDVGHVAGANLLLEVRE